MSHDEITSMMLRLADQVENGEDRRLRSFSTPEWFREEGLSILTAVDFVGDRWLRGAKKALQVRKGWVKRESFAEAEKRSDRQRVALGRTALT